MTKTVCGGAVMVIVFTASMALAQTELQTALDQIADVAERSQAAVAKEGEPANAKPFGLTMGMSLAELQKLPGYKPPTAPNLPATIQPPQPHPDFEMYIVVASPTHGLCKVAAVGKDIRLNSFGDRLKQEFWQVTEALQARYGKPEMYDRLKAGSIWNEPDDWTMGLLKEERILAASFETVPEFKVFLKSVAQSTSVGHLFLSYQAQNFTACLAEVTKAQNSAF